MQGNERELVRLATKDLTRHKIDFNVRPVQGHSMHGKVERKIKEINSSINKSLNNQRLSIIQWEKLAVSMANQINDLPLVILIY